MLASIGDEVARRLVTAILVESAVYPKPGLVDRVHSLPEIDLINLQSAAVSFYRWLRQAAISGAKKAWRGRLGGYMLRMVEEMLRVQDGGNTHLGVVVLVSPLSSAAGLLGSSERWRNPEKLRRAVLQVVEKTDWRDCRNILMAISRVSPGGLGEVPFLDVKKPETYRLIRERRASILETFRPYRGRDMIIDEYLDGYRLTFDICLRALKQWLRRTNNLEVSSVNALLEVMSRRPDTHISRRSGVEKARIVMTLAGRALGVGGAATKEGFRAILKLDEYMRRNDLRPGASADILDAALGVLFLGAGRYSREAFLDLLG
jgi:triphosphoribosyl-dephospho-CoA synthase